jgi:hypothetical protein
MEDYSRLWQWDATRDGRVGSSGRLVLEDGAEICSSESASEYSDHGEEFTKTYASGFQSLAEARMTEDQAHRLRNRGRAGGQATVSGTEFLSAHTSAAHGAASHPSGPCSPRSRWPGNSMRIRSGHIHGDLSALFAVET